MSFERWLGFVGMITLASVCGASGQTIQFQTPVQFDPGAFGMAVAIAELNGDERADLAVFNGNQDVLIYHSTPAGLSLVQSEFQDGVAFSPQLDAADMNADGRADLLVFMGGVVNLRILYQQISGPLQVTETGITGGFYFPQFTIGDVDGNGTPDLITTDPFSVRLNDGSGNFTAVEEPVFNSFFEPAAVRTNNDNLADVIMLGEVPGKMRHQRSLGGGVFDEPTIEPAPTNARPATADFNGDGYTDVAITQGLPAQTIFVRLANGDGTYGAPIEYVIGAATRAMVAADLDRDGNVDLAAVDIEADDVRIMRGAGDGTFTLDGVHPIPVGNHPTVPPNTSELEAGDFNGDGLLDLALAAMSDGVVTLTNATPFIYGDFDSDSDVDLADFGQFWQCLGGPDVPPPPACASAVDADFNLDGDVDLADFKAFTQGISGTP